MREECAELKTYRLAILERRWSVLLSSCRSVKKSRNVTLECKAWFSWCCDIEGSLLSANNDGREGGWKLVSLMVDRWMIGECCLQMDWFLLVCRLLITIHASLHNSEGFTDVRLAWMIEKQNAARQGSSSGWVDKRRQYLPTSIETSRSDVLEERTDDFVRVETTWWCQKCFEAVGMATHFGHRLCSWIQELDLMVFDIWSLINVLEEMDLEIDMRLIRHFFHRTVFSAWPW